MNPIAFCMNCGKYMSHHKYLNDIGIKSNECCIFNTSDKKDSRWKRFKKQRKKYGFDERETWSLDYTLMTWLYSHLKMYLDIGGKVVNLNFHKFDIPVLIPIDKDKLEYKEGFRYPKKYFNEIIENHTQLESINTAIDYIEKYFKLSNTSSAEDELKSTEYAQCALKIVTVIWGALWW